MRFAKLPYPLNPLLHLKQQSHMHKKGDAMHPEVHKWNNAAYEVKGKEKKNLIIAHNRHKALPILRNKEKQERVKLNCNFVDKYYDYD